MKKQIIKQFFWRIGFTNSHKEWDNLDKKLEKWLEENPCYEIEKVIPLTISENDRIINGWVLVIFRLFKKVEK